MAAVVVTTAMSAMAVVAFAGTAVVAEVVIAGADRRHPQSQRLDCKFSQQTNRPAMHCRKLMGIVARRQLPQAQSRVRRKREIQKIDAVHDAVRGAPARRRRMCPILPRRESRPVTKAKAVRPDVSSKIRRANVARLGPAGLLN